MQGLTLRAFPHLLERRKSFQEFCRYVYSSHYYVNGGFYEKDDWILANVDKIRHIPTTIIQGRYDMVCPALAAWDLHKVLRNLKCWH